MTVLVTPQRPWIGGEGPRYQRVQLHFLPALPPSNRACLIYPSGRLFTAEEFRRAQLKTGSWIVTDEPTRLERVVGIPADHPGVKRE